MMEEGGATIGAFGTGGKRGPNVTRAAEGGGKQEGRVKCIRGMCGFLFRRLKEATIWKGHRL